MQDLVLGVNAHINYDLVFALVDILALEWPQLSEDQRKMRYRDHCRVNEIIYHTIRAVQDQVIERYQPEFAFIDKALGPIDEWMTSLLISEWRQEVWEHATQILDSADGSKRQEILNHVEQVSIQQIYDWTLSLEEFEDEPSLCNDDILYAIYQDWFEENIHGK